MITLQPFGEHDFARLIGWVHTPEELIQWAGPVQFTFPLTDYQLARYLAGARGDLPSRMIFKAVDEAGRIVGHIELGAIDLVSETASVCRVMIAPEARGRGICLPMMRRTLALGFEDLQLRRIDLRVYSFNEPAIRCYERAGFIREGCMRKAVKIGDRYCDTVLMAMLREEWIASGGENGG